jgi:hypothetical protein
MRDARVLGVAFVWCGLVAAGCGGSPLALDGGSHDGKDAARDLAPDAHDARPDADAPVDLPATDRPAEHETAGDAPDAAVDARLDLPATADAADAPPASNDAQDAPDAAEAGSLPYDGSGALAWVQRSKGNGADQSFNMTVTTAGGLVVGGHFNGSDVFAPDSTTPRSFTSKGQDMWLTRSTADGALSWARTAGTSVQTTVSAVGPAPGDDVYVGGSTYAYPTDPLILGAGEPNQTTFTNIGTFFARYHADGSLVWAKVQQYGADPWRVLPAPDGGFFAMGDVGSFGATFGVGEAHQTTLIARAVPSSTPTFLARFGPDGQLAWVRTMGGIHPDAALMADGGIVVVGLFGGAAAVLEGGAVPDVTLVPDWFDLFIASYSSAGDLRWVKQVKGLPQVDPLATTVLSSGDIVVTASCEPFDDGTPQAGDAAHTQAVFGPGEPAETRIPCADFDLVMARYTPAGALVWAKSIPPAFPEIRGLAPLPDGGFVMASSIRKGDAVVFDPGAAGSISVQRLAPFGNLIMSWHRPDGTARAARIVATGAPRVLAMSVLTDASVVFAGAFSDTTVFGPQDAAKVSYTKTGGGYENILGEDMFLARLKP